MAGRTAAYPGDSLSGWEVTNRRGVPASPASPASSSPSAKTITRQRKAKKENEACSRGRRLSRGTCPDVPIHTHLLLRSSVLPSALAEQASVEAEGEGAEAEGGEKRATAE
jgi:hypothetical protein